MNISTLRPFANLASWRFKFFSFAPRADGDKWAGHGGPALPFLRESTPRSPRLRVSLHPTFKIQHSKFLLLCVLGVLAVNPSSFAATTITETFTVNSTIPDNDDLGLADYRNISTPGLTEIESITVGLNFTGGWNGDLYVHLVHGSGFSVLLNRPGRTSGNPDGAGSSGMTILLDDLAPTDIHTAIANSGLATGTYQPDARTADPLVVTDLSPRSAFLSSFIGLNPNGAWTLFVVDQGPGAVSTLQSWTLNITAVPEPSAVVFGLVSGALLLRRKRPR
jgi:subtilisin-like proprotein convertase family protein